MIKTPSKATLKRYGLSEAAWKALLEAQGGVCAICKQEPTTGRTVIDHEHVKGWKKMPDELRSRYVRGICCWWCNATYLGRGITVEKAENVVQYLKDYRNRRPQ